MILTIRRIVWRFLELFHLQSLYVQIRHKSLFKNLFFSKKDNYWNFKLPKAHLRAGTIGTTDPYQFVWSGRLTITRILDLLLTYDVDINEIERILDFGSGSGRLTVPLINYFPNATICGCDTGYELVDWCSKNLYPGEFKQSSFAPPITYDNNSFDLVISYSVFTHIHANAQKSWLHEIYRIIKRGGCFIFSTTGYYDIFLDNKDIPKEALDNYKNGVPISLPIELIPSALNTSKAEKYSALENYLNTYHPLGSVEELCRETGFKVLGCFKGLKSPPMISSGQNLHLCRKLE